MASLLVRVDRAVLDALRGRAENERATLRSGELPQPELMHLDPQGIAVVVWLDGNRLRIGASVHEVELDRGRLVGGDVWLHDHDVSHLLERLGMRSDETVETWSALPRLLPPSDVDLLRYELGLPMEARKHLVREPIVVATEDEVDRDLLAAIWADPDADEPRMIYADRLQERADPRGELISLQLIRGHGAPSARERELVDKWKAACGRPLASFLAAFELRRGFPAIVTIDWRQPIPGSLLAHPAWSTIEDLDTDHQALLRGAPLRSLRTLRTDARTFAYLSFGDRVFERVERIVGHPARPMSGYRALALEHLAAWNRIGTSTVWPALRTLSASASHDHGPMMPRLILGSPLGKRLTHLDLVVDSTGPRALDAHHLHRELATAATLRRLTLLATFEPTLVPVTLAFERDDRGVFELVLQIPPLGVSSAAPLVAWIDPLGRGVDRISVQRLAGHKGYDPGTERALITRLRRLFSRVEHAEGEHPPICPWAYRDRY